MVVNFILKYDWIYCETFQTDMLAVPPEALVPRLAVSVYCRLANFGGMTNVMVCLRWSNSSNYTHGPDPTVSQSAKL